jgi:biopolymer transport protein ExbB
MQNLERAPEQVAAASSSGVFGFDLGAALQGLWDDAVVIWAGGGPAMVAIAVIALAMFAIGCGLFLRLRAKGYRAVPERTWRHWIEYPDAREGPIGELLDFVTGGHSVEETAFFFRQLRTNELPPIERELKVMRIFVSAAPLVGLLGTVTGMLATFGALSSGSGGDKTMAMVAKGISEALITTETGLVVALPGLFFQYQLGRGFDRYKAFLAHLETVCTQVFHRREVESEEHRARRAAQLAIAVQLREHLQEQGSEVATVPAAGGTTSTRPNETSARQAAGRTPSHDPALEA